MVSMFADGILMNTALNALGLPPASEDHHGRGEDLHHTPSLNTHDSYADKICPHAPCNNSIAHRGSATEAHSAVALPGLGLLAHALGPGWPLVVHQGIVSVLRPDCWSFDHPETSFVWRFPVAEITAEIAASVAARLLPARISAGIRPHCPMCGSEIGCAPVALRRDNSIAHLACEERGSAAKPAAALPPIGSWVLIANRKHQVTKLFPWADKVELDDDPARVLHVDLLGPACAAPAPSVKGFRGSRASFFAEGR
jgi:hypothetical protein